MFATVRCGFRLWMWIRTQLRTLCPPKAVEYSCFATNHIHSDTGSLVATLQYISRKRPHHSPDTCVCIQYNDEPTRETSYEELFRCVPPPWLGIYCDGIDMTSTVFPFVSNGNHIRPCILESISKGKWTYLSAVTFEEEDFPSEGILIGHVQGSPTVSRT
jgi:hypothetical protein